MACAAESEGFRRKTNSQTPEPEGSGKKHCETKQPTRLLCDSIIFHETTKLKILQSHKTQLVVSNHFVQKNHLIGNKLKQPKTK